MELLEPYNFYLFVAGIIIIIMVLMRQLGQRHRYDARKRAEREAAIQMAREAEHKSQMQSVMQPSKVIQSQTRLPLGNPLGAPFVGNIQGSAAKWEVEIHNLGRQIIGQIDSKMSALQAITLDANRTANRLEILVEHLEQIARKQIDWQQTQQAQYTKPEPLSEEQSAMIPTAAAPEAAPLVDMLKELADDLEGIHTAIKRSTTLNERPTLATVLRLEDEPSDTDLHSKVEMLSNYGVEPQEIARRLNISLGEVDVMLQIQQNRLER